MSVYILIDFNFELLTLRQVDLNTVLINNYGYKITNALQTILLMFLHLFIKDSRMR